MITLDRWRRVTLRELAGRGRQRVSQWIDWVAPPFGPGGEPRGVRGVSSGGDADHATRGAFQRAAPWRFFPSATDDRVAHDLAERFPAASRQILSAAAGICAGRFNLLGYEGLDFGNRIDWHRDPVAGRSAPRRHWSRLNPLDARALGDSKLIWELNRHQWLVTLAQAYRSSGEVRFAERGLALVDDWIAANPYPIGVNWNSSLEVALRIVSWCWTLVLLRDWPGLTDERFARWRALICAHACRVERYLSYYFSPNTHLTGEALGLFYAGVVFADHPDAARWRDVGRQILVDEAARQISPDGVYIEQATCYHRYTIEIYLHFLILASQNRIGVPVAVREAVVRMVRYLVAVTPADRMMPNIGDADGGWLLPLVERTPADCRGVFAVAAAVFEEPEFAWAAGGAAPEVLWLLGSAGMARVDQLAARPPASAPSCVFETGGYAVMRSGWHAEAHQLIMDVGPLGCDVSGAHGHADLLSIQCTAFGEPYLIDPGTYCYTAEPQWRDYFRGTAAHNTVVIDGRSQADPIGPFAWRARPSARLRGWKSSPHADFVEADHDAYTRLTQPVSHRRRVVFLKPIGWVIVDDLTGVGDHRVELRFHFSPRRVSMAAGLWVRARGERGRGLWLVSLAAVPLSGVLRQGQEQPIDGWYSPAYGVRRPAPTVTYAANARMPLRVTTIVIPADPLLAEPPAVDISRNRAGDVSAIRLPASDSIIKIDDTALSVTPADDDSLRIA